ncbi:MAG TPA: glycoside hydrolase family 97 protein [Bryobacteraceae bacterium]|nr:glycoside hydrolase family 97 protein [Bryobacteraceae bacterium]
MLLRSAGIAALFAFFQLASVLFAQDAPASLKSPDGRISATFETIQKDQPSATGQLVYSVSFEGKPLLDRSNLSLTLQGQRPLGAFVRIVSQTPSQSDSTYRLVTGKASTVRDHYNALRINLAEDNFPHRKLAIEARAYDDGFAFRYLVPDQSPIREFRETQEATEFRISKDAITYALVLPHYRTMYESEYIKLNASAFANANGLSGKVLIGLPLLMQVPGVGWLAITEANLRGNSSMYLVNPSKEWGGHWFESRLAPGDDPEVAVTGTLPHHSAWRVLLIGEEPGRLIESNIITSLNPESEIKDTSWIHAGLTAWDWWSGSIGPDGKRAFTTATMKYYVDFAAKSGFPYMLVDAGWSVPYDITKMNGKVDIPELVRYAAAKNVKIWIWLAYRDADAQMAEAFPLYEKWGVAGLKIDFVERDDQRGIDFYYRAAQQAAEHHLMVDFHGATKPTGISRTFPNVLGYEAVLGMEQSRAGGRDNPGHRVTIPFTRMLAGRMDYTPGGFDNVTEADFVARAPHPMVMGTRAAQLAMYAIYEAPFQMVSDTPKAYEDQPAFDFIKHAPATWDETKVLDGLPGEFITVARRKGDEWFLGSMTNWSQREFDVPLTFLGPGRYTAEIYADAPDAGQYPKSVSVRKQTVDRDTKLNVKMAPGGGYAVRFVPVK